MTRLLKQAFEEASKLPAEEQDALARALLDELAAEERWERAFDTTQGALTSLADEALAEHRAGRTELLDPDRP
jgi:hypothetical protein